MPSFVASAASAVVVATIALSDTHSSLADAAPVFNTPIEHVVVLMEEVFVVRASLPVVACSNVSHRVRP